MESVCLNDVKIEALRLEGKIFLLQRQMDRNGNLNEHTKLKAMLEFSKIQHGQYMNVVEEHEKQKELARLAAIKRKMNK